MSWIDLSDNTQTWWENARNWWYVNPNYYVDCYVEEEFSYSEISDEANVWQSL